MVRFIPAEVQHIEGGSPHLGELYGSEAQEESKVMLGWIIVGLSALYGGWLALAFVIAVPPPEYMIPRIVLMTAGLVVGWYLSKKH